MKYATPCSYHHVRRSDHAVLFKMKEISRETRTFEEQVIFHLWLFAVRLSDVYRYLANFRAERYSK